MKLGLLGGTFDPVHRGHLKVAQAALDRGLERIDLVPARRPPHKQRPDIAGPFHRFAMAALATAGRKDIGVCVFEVARDAPSYTIDTVRHFAEQGHSVTLIMGSDSLADIETWKQSRPLLDLARIIVYPRRPALPAAIDARLPAWVAEKMEGPERTIEVLPGPPDDVSSSEIRQKIQRGEKITGLLPEEVEEYIRKQNLYAH